MHANPEINESARGGQYVYIWGPGGMLISAEIFSIFVP